MPQSLGQNNQFRPGTEPGIFKTQTRSRSANAIGSTLKVKLVSATGDFRNAISIHVQTSSEVCRNYRMSYC